MERFVVPQGEFALATTSSTQQESLRAWDAADEYLLQQASELGDLSGNLLLINDRCGALAVALSACEPSSLGDSYVSQLATTANLERNKIDPSSVTLPAWFRTSSKSGRFSRINFFGWRPRCTPAR